MGRDDSVDKTQEEIVEEIAKALGHSGDMLEGVLEKMAGLEKKMEGVHDVEKYNSCVDRYNELRKEAISRREMLMIHREAIGIHRHPYVDSFYPIPPKKRKKHGNE